MHEYHLLEILAIGFAFALLFGYLAIRLGLSPIVGYLLAGFLVGPHSPGFVADMNLAMQLSEAGVILLMFGVGLHFNLKDLMAVKGVAIPGAVVQIAGATACGLLAASFFGFDIWSGLILGFALAVASTVVLLRVLMDNDIVQTVHGHVAIGWLIVEDLFTVLLLVLLPILAANMQATESIALWDILKGLGLAVLRLGALWVIVLVVGGKVVPWLLAHVVRTRSQELFTLTVLVAAFATAVGAAVLFHASMALGAFLGGMVVGKTKISHQAGADVLPLRDAFAVLFFLSVGMLFEPAFLLREPWLVLTCLVIILVVKPLTTIITVSLIGYPVRTALTVAAGLSQIGEFSFILAQAANGLGLIPADIYSALVVCSLVSISLNPGLFKQLPALERLLAKNKKLWALLTVRSERKFLKTSQQLGQASSELLEDIAKIKGEIAIVVGYGPTGRSVAQALFDKGITPVVVDMNVDTVTGLAKEGKKAVFGNATKESILRAAGVEKAAYLIITLPSIADTAATATCARAINSSMRIIARARFLEDGKLLNRAGVTEVVFEEKAIAKDLTELLLPGSASGNDSAE